MAEEAAGEEGYPLAEVGGASVAEEEESGREGGAEECGLVGDDRRNTLLDFSNGQPLRGDLSGPLYVDEGMGGVVTLRGGGGGR